MYLCQFVTTLHHSLLFVCMYNSLTPAPPIMVGREENILNSRRSRMAKTPIFWTLVSLLTVSALKLPFFLFFLCFLFFFCYAKKWGGVGEGGWPPASRCCQICNIITDICKQMIWISNSELIYSLQKKLFLDQLQEMPIPFQCKLI